MYQRETTVVLLLDDNNLFRWATNAIDLRALDRHRDAAMTSLIPELTLARSQPRNSSGNFATLAARRASSLVSSLATTLH